MPGQWVVAGLLITVGGALRIYDLRSGKFRFMPWPMTIIAFVMPRPTAHSYLETVGHQVNEVQDQVREQYMRDAIKAAPKTLVTLWCRWARDTFVRVTVGIVSRRVHHVQPLIEDATASPRRYRVVLRRLRLCCRLILCATGNGKYHQYAAPARALLSSCRHAAEDDGSAELAALVRQDVEKLACALANRRPDRA